MDQPKSFWNIKRCSYGEPYIALPRPQQTIYIINRQFEIGLVHDINIRTYHYYPITVSHLLQGSQLNWAV